ncbi:MAG: tetratricopeptide repeat protein, partial [Alphaproteobacteria bacterium]
SDAGRWALLARSYIALGRSADAAKAVEEAIDRTDPPDPGLIGEYGETLVAAAQGRIPPDAEAAFARVLTLQPDDARARYYLAMARAEKGDVAGAQADLEALLRTAPADAPWRATVFEALQDLGANPEIPADVAPEPAAAPPAAEAPRGPSQADLAAAQDMSPEDRQAMIRGMVDGLAARLQENPDDFQGWIRLANSYMVLQEPAKAADALRRALKMQPGNVGLLLQVAEIEIDVAGGEVTPEAESALRRALDRQPGNPQALWRLGQAAAARGETDEARRMWTELLPKLMEADPLKAEVRKALEAL